VTQWTVLLTDLRHSGCLVELAECLLYGLRGLGLNADLSRRPLPGTRHIVLDAHRLTEIPSDSIIYQTEVPGSGWWNAAYLDKLRRHEVWEYSEENAPRYADYGLTTPKVVSPGWVLELERIPIDKPKEIDVLFYGSPCERRTQVMHDLTVQGLKTMWLLSFYGQERDVYIARSKVVLSMHFYPNAPRDHARTFYLYTNHVAVVAESSAGFTGTAFNQLAPECRRLIDSQQYKKLGGEGYDQIRARPMAETIGAALQAP